MFNNQNEIETSIYKAKKKYTEYHESFKYDAGHDESEGDDTNFNFDRKSTSEKSPTLRKAVKVTTPNHGSGTSSPMQDD